MIKLIKKTFYNEHYTKKKLTEFIDKSTQLSFGEECARFEKRFASWQKRKYCVFLNSGSSANLAIIQALLNLGKIKKGDTVGFSALTWSTNVMPLIQLGLQPVPIDIELDTLNISSRQLLNVLKKNKLRMIVITNLLGFCDDIDEIKKICNREKIILIEDNCESLGTVYRGKKLGNFGLASTFSFYVGHHLSTIEGGAVCTDNLDLSTMLQLVRAHGWDRNLTQGKQEKMRNRHKINSIFYSRYTFYDLGYNLRPTEINGCIGNIQLSYLEEIIKIRNRNFLTIAPILYRNSSRYYPIRYDHITFVSNFAIPLVCKSQKIRDEVVQLCTGDVEIRPIVGGDIAEQPFFHKYTSRSDFKNFNAKIVHDQGLYFGNNPDLTKKDLDFLTSFFNSSLT